MRPQPAIAPAARELSELQKKTIQAIVNIFETGQVQGDYAKVTLLAGDFGHLTYGRSQTTLAGGNLHLLIKAYCEADRASFADALTPYLARLAGRDLSLDQDLSFRRLLADAGNDPVMHTTQDEFFDRVYWLPSLLAARGARLLTALGTGVTYDSTIHGSWNLMRARTDATFGDVQTLGEDTWVRRYVETRREWLATHSNQLLRRTVYRMDAFAKLIQESKWDLELPLTVRGARIDADALLGAPLRVSAETEVRRVLKLETPYMIGQDVRELQQALATNGFAGTIDGIYGPLTEANVRLFQTQNGLKPDGLVGPATRAALGL